MLNLSKEQEKYLVSLGLQKLIEDTIKRAKQPKQAKEVKKKRWTRAQREKFISTMKKKWRGKKGKK